MKTIAQIIHNINQLEILDNSGMLIYWEHVDKYWEKRKYDSHGNVIHYESSTTYWWKSEYDSNGKRIYFEDSGGVYRGI